MFRDYEEDVKEQNRIKEEKERKKQLITNRLLSKVSSGRAPSRAQSSAGSLYSQDGVTSRFGSKKKIYTYEILLRYFLKNVDILLMLTLYYAGCNRVDVYHCFLLILFAIYIMYQDGFRKNFKFLLYFMAFIATIKYFYVLFLPEFEKNTKLNDIFIVLGFATDTIDGNKYGKSNLFNNNYLLVFTGYLQYTLYTSEYSKSAFSLEQAENDAKAFGRKYPRLTLWLTVISEVIQMAIPWFTYFIFLMIAVLNNKSIINWVLLLTTLLLFFWHCSADLVTANSHLRLTRGWGVFTFIAAV